MAIFPIDTLARMMSLTTFQRRLLLVTLGVALTFVVLIYGLWQLSIRPANLERFDAQVNTNVERYQQRIQAYLLDLRQSANTIVKGVPVGFFDMSFDKRRQWQQQRQAAWLDRLADAKSINLFSKGDFLQHHPEAPTSFVVIDMVNRLGEGLPAVTEVSKKLSAANGLYEWQLHHMAPVSESLGFVHIVFSLEGLQRQFADVDPKLGKITLHQTIDKQAALLFFTMGQANSVYSKVLVDVSQSYWQLSYRPSAQLWEQVQRVPWWLWILVVLMAVVLLCLVFGIVSPHWWHWLLKSLHKAPHKRSAVVMTATQNIESENIVTETITHTEQGEAHNHNVIANIESASMTPRVTSVPESIFRAYDIRGIAYDQLTSELMYAIGQAVASEALAKGESAMVVGYDARTHSPDFVEQVIQGVISTGCHVINIGLVPTPLMNFAACEHLQTSSGLIVTASHNSKEYNGLKMVVKGQTLVDDDIQRLKTRIIDQDFQVGKGDVSQDDFSQAYISRVANDVAVIDGWHIVIDAGNGAASKLAPELFTAMGCRVSTLFCDFDGTFPNHDPDPSAIGNLQPLVEKVISEKADMGIAFDGDGDRLMVVSASGKIIWPDQLLMLFARDIVSRHPGSDIIFDVKSSSQLQRVILEEGGRPVMWKTGHSHIKAKMCESNALLAGEFSGHIFFKERWYGFDDGLYVAARLLEILTLTGESLDSLLVTLPSMLSTPEIKIAVAEEKKFALVEKLIQEANFPGGKRTVVDGLRIDFDNGWGLVRASNTAPALTLRFEAVDDQTLVELKTLFKNELHKVDASLAVDF